MSWKPGDRREPVKAMIRVDQAGEYGATRIYAGQLAVLGDRHPFARAIHHMAAQEERHRAFFDNALGFKQLGEAKMNPRVSVQGILMCVELAYMTEQIQRYGGKGNVPGVRSFYPHFFSPREEIGIVNRMLDLPNGKS